MPPAWRVSRRSAASPWSRCTAGLGSNSTPGSADWDFIAGVKAAVGIPVIANGDITTVEQAAEARTRSGADGVMVGRGCYGRPWFPAQVAAYLRDGTRLADPALADQKAILLEHYDAMLAHFGVQPGLRLGRKHIAWYSRGLHGSAEFRATVMRCDDVPSVRRLIDGFYDPLIEASLNEAAGNSDGPAMLAA